MTTDLQSTSLEPTSIPFGLRLQNAREALGLESKDAAAQLRLNERVILMLESDCYSSDLPATFVRGYIRSYGKLLQIPEEEIKQAIAPIKPQPSLQPAAPKTAETPKVTSSHYFMQISTYLVVLTLIGLVGTWWYSHSNTSNPILAQNPIQIPDQLNTEKKAESGMTVKNEIANHSLLLGAKMAEPISAGAIIPDAISAAKTTVAEETPNKTPPIVEEAKKQSQPVPESDDEESTD